MVQVAALLLSLLFSSTSFAQTTIIRGVVTDADSGQPVPQASVYFRGSKGVPADSLGRFEIRTDFRVSQLEVSYIGYQTQTVPVTPGKEQTVRVALTLDASKDLGAVVVRSKKKIRYTNKNNPAVELIRRVIAAKDQNRPQVYAYVEYEQYEKVQLSLSRVSKKLANNSLLKNYRFVFENTDTTKVAGKALTPVYLEEKLARHFYRQDPRKTKTLVEGERRVNFGEAVDSAGVSTTLKRLYEDIDVYANNIQVFTNQFLSPLADMAPSFYMFFIRDTLTGEGGKKAVRMYFTPRNTNDFLFRGTMLISLDSTYALQQVDMTVSPNINMNWVRDLRIRQAFEKNDVDGRYHLVKSNMITELGITRGKSNGLYGERSVSYKNYRINQPQDDAFYSEGPVVLASYQQYTDSFWTARRHDTLSQAEAKVYRNVDSLRKMRSFQRLMDWGTLLLAGYKSFGPVEMGPANTFYSFNPVEGFRLRLGGRTTTKLSKRFYLEGYAAYGLKDEKWKGFGSFTYSLNNKSVYGFPLHYVRVSAQRETKIPGQELQFVQEDNFLLSFKRGDNNKWLYNDIYRLDYVRELANHFSYTIGFKNWRQAPAGALHYQKLSDGKEEAVAQLTTSELSVKLRWAPNEQFYQGKLYRTPVVNRFPIFTLQYTKGVKGLWNGAYDYDKVDLMIEKRFYLSQLGYSDVVVEGGYTRGTLPFPLLSIHRANQTYSYQLRSFNLMNFLEFVSDRYASVNIDHHFNGFLFNRIPLLNRLSLREIVSAKVLYGGVRRANDPANKGAGVYHFPADDQDGPTTFSLNDGPYVEGSVGVGNIFKLLRLDLVRRFTYLDHPNVSEWGIRGRVKFDF
ncbi:carboxypeptidase-like regulatory domain-containing protein [Flavisolibacter sp. BT320]|nr:carboxypeptidase-like regulatory domain-containing protein [Flavisolibacter longurius]